VGAEVLLLQVGGKRVKRDSCILQRKLGCYNGCKRAVVDGRLVKRDPHMCCTRAANRSKR
jgi:hypothetical protein